MRLNILLALLVLCLALDQVNGGCVLSSCARMNDGGAWPEIARYACIGTCKLQNCGTGYCQNRYDENCGRVGPVCACSRCDNGGGWPGRRKRSTYLCDPICSIKCKNNGCSTGRCDLNGHCVCRSCYRLRREVSNATSWDEGATASVGLQAFGAAELAR